MGVPGSISNGLVNSLISAKGGLIAIEAADTAVFSNGNGVTPAAIVNVGYASASHHLVSLLYKGSDDSDDDIFGSGGGTWTPDTRIMIPLL